MIHLSRVRKSQIVLSLELSLSLSRSLSSSITSKKLLSSFVRTSTITNSQNLSDSCARVLLFVPTAESVTNAHEDYEKSESRAIASFLAKEIVRIEFSSRSIKKYNRELSDDVFFVTRKNGEMPFNIFNASQSANTIIHRHKHT